MVLIGGVPREEFIAELIYREEYYKFQETRFKTTEMSNSRSYATGFLMGCLTTLELEKIVTDKYIIIKTFKGGKEILRVIKSDLKFE